MDNPAWLDRDAYPFASRYFATAHGRMHYVDEGKGAPIVFVHGNPSWSYQFRNVIKSLRDNHRCIAPDHLGFGLSDKPVQFSYLPQAHAENFTRFLDALDLKNATLVVNDWGGPIGLSYALEHPERVARLMLTNTWMWSVRDDWYYRGFSGFMGSALGRYLIRERNLFADKVVSAAFGTKSRLTREIHRHYLSPLSSPELRKGSWVFPREIIGSSDWLASLWERREMLQNNKVAIVWGMKDIAFRAKELARWCALFPAARVVRCDDVGHYVSEEVPSLLAEEIVRLMAD